MLRKILPAYLLEGVRGIVSGSQFATRTSDSIRRAAQSTQLGMKSMLIE
jgi:hypothetical protein